MKKYLLFFGVYFLLSILCVSFSNAAKEDPCKEIYKIYQDECVNSKSCSIEMFANVNMKNYDYYSKTIKEDAFKSQCENACQGKSVLSYEDFKNSVCLKKGEKKSMKIDHKKGDQISIDKESNSIILNGKPIWREEDAFTIGIKKRFKMMDADVVLIMINSGGTACPALYRFLTVNKNSAYTLSKTFGSCSDLPKIQSKGNKIIVKFPVSHNEFSTVIYDAGRITEDGKTVGIEIQSK